MTAEEAVQREVETLMDDDIIITMACELVAKAVRAGADPIRWIDEGGSEYMRAAYCTYQQRGGQANTSIGSPGMAVRRVSTIIRDVAVRELGTVLDRMKDALDQMVDDIDE